MCVDLGQCPCLPHVPPPRHFAQVFKAGEAEFISVWRRRRFVGLLPPILGWRRISMIVADWKLLDPQDKALICGGGFKRT